jgi:arylsulfatase A-like enzyme
MTGQYPLTHGVFVNDVPLHPKGVTLGQSLADASYHTAWIGKWHVDGRGRSAFIPPERRMGFQFWRTMECTHNYMKSDYYADTPQKLRWEGYDAEAQAREAQKFIREHPQDKPFALFISWGPPHDPYEQVPAEFLRQFPEEKIRLRPNVPASKAGEARERLSGYYAHCLALDTYFGDLLDTLQQRGLDKNTIVVFTSDHGDMHCSQGSPSRKQQPWEESIAVPLLIRHPAMGGKASRIPNVIESVDLMPTLLGLCGAAIPDSVQGRDFSGPFRGGTLPPDQPALLSFHFPFHDWRRDRGGREWRGLRSQRHTYVRDLNGPWLLYDNIADPFQLTNLCDRAEVGQLQRELEAALVRRLAEIGDEFLPGEEYLRRWGYDLDPVTHDIPIRP